MKRIILPAFFLITSYTVSAQQRVGIGTNTPAEKLDVAGNNKKSLAKGFLKNCNALILSFILLRKNKT